MYLYFNRRIRKPKTCHLGHNILKRRPLVDPGWRHAGRGSQSHAKSISTYNYCKQYVDYILHWNNNNTITWYYVYIYYIANIHGTKYCSLPYIFRRFPRPTLRLRGGDMNKQPSLTRPILGQGLPRRSRYGQPFSPQPMCIIVHPNK